MITFEAGDDYRELLHSLPVGLRSVRHVLVELICFCPCSDCIEADFLKLITPLSETFATSTLSVAVGLRVSPLLDKSAKRANELRTMISKVTATYLDGCKVTSLDFYK